MRSSLADVVGNGREAIWAAADHDYPLILMDLRMPEVDGFDATRAIRSSGGRAPIVAVTANAARADREACLAAGMDDHLGKPVTLESLRRVITRWLPVDGDLPTLTDDPGPPASPIHATLDQRAGELDAAELRRVAHTLRGATAIFGGTQVVQACTALEQAASDELAADHAQALVQVVERACGEARAAMLAWLDAA